MRLFILVSAYNTNTIQKSVIFKFELFLFQKRIVVKKLQKIFKNIGNIKYMLADKSYRGFLKKNCCSRDFRIWLWAFHRCPISKRETAPFSQVEKHKNSSKSHLFARAVKHHNFQVTSCHQNVSTNVDFAYIESE